jgi:hypothetical protein
VIVPIVAKVPRGLFEVTVPRWPRREFPDAETSAAFVPFVGGRGGDLGTAGWSQTGNGFHEQLSSTLK